MSGARGAGSILRRHLRAGRGPAVVVALLVFVATGLVAVIPGISDAIGAAELRYQIGQLGVGQRFLTTRLVTPPPLGPPTAGSADPSSPGLPADVAQLWGGLDGALQQLVDRSPQPLRSVLGAPRYTAVSDPVAIAPSTDPPIAAQLQLALAADPHLAQSATLVTGVWPGPDRNEVAARVKLGVALSVAGARALGWSVGATRDVVARDGHLFPLVLTGTFAPAGGSDDHWALNPSIIEPKIEQTPGEQVRTGTAYVHPASWPLVEALAPVGQTQIYVPLDVTRLPAADISAVRAQLDTFTAAGHQLTGPDDPAPLRLHSGSADVLGAVLHSSAAATSVLAIIAIGPCGAAIAVLVLACRLLVDRRRRGFAVLAARGWSSTRLGAALAAEGLLAAAPACLAAAALAWWLRPPDDGTPLVVGGTAVLLLCVLQLGVSARRNAFRPSRGDLSVRSGWRWRWVAELAVIGAAVAAVLVLLSSTGPADGDPGTDPLTVGAPLLVCVAAAVVVARCYPLPLLGLVRTFRRRRDLVHFLGPVRALRDPPAGVVPVLALVIGVAMAVVSASLFSTLDAGVTAAARSTVGADLRVDAGGLPAEVVARVRALPEVAALGSSAQVSAVQVTISGVEQAVPVYLVDAGGLRQVQGGVEGAVRLPPALSSTGTGDPIVISATLAAQLALQPDPALAVGDKPLTVVGTAATTAGLGGATTWVLADASRRQDFGVGRYLPDTLLIDLAPGVDASRGAAAVRAALDGTGEVTTPAAVTSRLRAAPVISGMRSVVLAALAAMALLSALAVTFTTVGAAPARRRMLAVLQILGLPRGAGRALVGWELIPLAAATLVGGFLLGGGLSALVTSAVDLRPFTGGTFAVQLIVDPVTLALLVGGFAAVVATTASLGAGLAGRVSPAVVLRFGDL